MKIFNSRIMTIAILIPFIFPHLFDNIPILNISFNFFQLIAFFIIFAKFGLKKTSKVIYFLLLFRLGYLIPTIANHGSIYIWFALTFKIISICYITDIALKINYMNYLESIILVIVPQLIINLITYNYDFSQIFNVSSDTHLLGIRTRFTDIVFPFISIIMFKKNIIGKFEKGDLLNLTLAIITIFIAWIGTGIIGLILYFGIYYFTKKSKRFINYFTLNKLSLIALIFNILIIFYRIQNVFSFLIVDVLHKSLTFTGRTYIWDIAIKLIQESLIWGHGVSESGAFVYLWHSWWMAHSQLLQSLYEGGIVTIILFAFVIILCSRKIKKDNTKIVCFPIVLMIFVLFIMMLAERFLNYSYIYILFILIYNASYINGFKEDKNGTDISYSANAQC